MKYDLEIEKTNSAGYINMIVHAAPEAAMDYQMKVVQYMNGLNKLLNIKKEKKNDNII